MSCPTEPTEPTEPTPLAWLEPGDRIQLPDNETVTVSDVNHRPNGTVLVWYRQDRTTARLCGWPEEIVARHQEMERDQ